MEKLIKVTVISVDRGRVRLGFEAAGDIPILRWEVWQRIRAGLSPNGIREVPSPSVE